MEKVDAIGVVETQYFTVAMELLDEMCKATNVTYLSSEKYLGGRLVTLVVGGSVSDVSTAIEIVKEIGLSKESSPVKMALVITNPHEEILRYIMPLEKPKKKKSIKVAGKKKETPKKTSKKADIVDKTNKDLSETQK